jgi:hypothetical protein
MKRITRVFAALAMLASHSGASGQAGGVADTVLRCDPGIRIDGIDGDGRYVIASYGATFTDCEIHLPPGKHVVKACYELTGPGPVPETLTCDQKRELEFDATAGSVYRLRLQITPTRVWKAWIEDVTSAEGNVAAPPRINKSRKDLPKDQRKSMVLVRSSERDEPAFLKGEVAHVWFRMKDLRQALSSPSKMRGEKNGYFTDKFSNGDSIGIYYMFHQEGSAFSRRFDYVCDTELPVYEDLPGGKVLYLGDYHFEPAPDGGRRFTVTHDIDAARDFLRVNHPELVDQLMVADYRMLRTPEICGVHQGRLRSAGPVQ